MTASILIIELERLRAIHGDCEVCVWGKEGIDPVDHIGYEISSKSGWEPEEIERYILIESNPE